MWSYFWASLCNNHSISVLNLPWRFAPLGKDKTCIHLSYMWQYMTWHTDWHRSDPEWRFASLGQPNQYRFASTDFGCLFVVTILRMFYRGSCNPMIIQLKQQQQRQKSSSNNNNNNTVSNINESIWIKECVTISKTNITHLMIVIRTLGRVLRSMVLGMYGWLKKL